MSFVLHPECEFVVSGNLVRDTVVSPVTDIVYGGTVWVEKMVSVLGGNGANTAFGLATLGARVTLLSACGDDEAGEASLRELQQAGVRTLFTARMGHATARTIALVKPGGERAFLHHPGVNRTALDGPLDFHACDLPPEKPWHYHLANPFALPAFRSHAAQTLNRANHLGATTTLDTGWDSQGRWLEDLAPCLPLIDLLFLNDREAEALTGEREAGRMASAMHRLGARRLVLKLGEQGCLVSDDDDREVVPPFHVNATDTTGAGDAFVAGFLAALSRGMAPATAARFANAVGALSACAPGSTQGVLSWEKTIHWIEQQEAEV
jgi:sugar/nucleoside kinase (ribokinase family)